MSDPVWTDALTEREMHHGFPVFIDDRGRVWYGCRAEPLLAEDDEDGTVG